MENGTGCQPAEYKQVRRKLIPEYVARSYILKVTAVH